jgi:hypothetical protein
MNVFLIMRLSDAPLSIRDQATLWHPIGKLTMKEKFQLESSVFEWPERDICFRPLHSSPWLDALSQANLSHELLSVSFHGNGQAAPEYHIDLIKLIVIIGISPMMVSSSRLLRHWLLWHFHAIQKSSTLLQIMSCCAMDLTPLFSIIKSTEQYLPLLFGWVAAFNSCDRLH